MDSVAIAWSKQYPNTVGIIDDKNKKTKRLNKKNGASKQKRQRQHKKKGKVTGQNPPRNVRFDEVISGTNFYEPLKSTNSVFTLKSATNKSHQIQMFKGHRICTRRAGIATFLIAALLFIAAGISAGVVFTVIKADNSSSSNNINQNLVIATSTELPMSTIIAGSQSGSPCSPSTYTSINDPSRSYNYTGNLGTCDNGYPFVTSNGGAWIRFEGSGGTKIPTWQTDVNHCNTYLTVWSNTTLPTIPNVIVNGTTCVIGVSIRCISTTSMSVIYCPGNYYVYFLPPITVCTARYCTI